VESYDLNTPLHRNTLHLKHFYIYQLKP
jgi:hypothetical protein